MQKSLKIIITVFFISSINLFAQFNSLKELSKAFYSLKSQPAQGYSVKDLSFSKDIGIINLNNGEMYLYKLGDRIVAGVFIGAGNFSYSPKRKDEKIELKKAFKKVPYSTTFCSAVIFAGDSTLDSIEKHSTKIEEKRNNAGYLLKRALDYYYKHDFLFFKSYSSLLLDNRREPYFNIGFKTNDSLFVDYLVDPHSKEEIFLSYGDYNLKIGDYLRYVSQQKTTNHSLICENDPICVNDYKIKINIASNYDFSAYSELTITTKDDKRQFLPFSLYHKLKVDSIIDDKGNKLTFDRLDDYSLFWIKLDKPINTGESKVIKILYHGDLITKTQNYAFMPTTTGWYPSPNYSQKSNFHLSFKIPNKLSISATGDRVSDSTDSEFHYSTWVSNNAISNATFNIGEYHILNFPEKKIPNIELQYAYYTKEQIETIKKNIEIELNYFYNAYGSIPYKTIYISELDQWFLEANNNIINLHPYIFLHEFSEKANLNFINNFSLLWWDSQIGYKTYRDEWMRSAFEQISSLTFVRDLKKDLHSVAKILQESKKIIFENNKKLSSGFDSTVALTIGYRNEYRDNYLYRECNSEKSLYVLYMLQNLLIDYKTMDCRAFDELIRGFYKEYKNKIVTTEDFEYYIESKTHQDYNWFFNEWVYDNRMPEYEFSYKIEKTNDDKYKVRYRIIQSDNTSDFKMYVPITINYSNNCAETVKVLVNGKKTEGVFESSAIEPVNLIFNDYESVLCDYKAVEWEE